MTRFRTIFYVFYFSYFLLSVFFYFFKESIFGRLGWEDSFDFLNIWILLGLGFYLAGWTIQSLYIQSLKSEINDTLIELDTAKAKIFDINRIKEADSKKPGGILDDDSF